MNILTSITYNFEITGLNKGILHPCTHGLRTAVIHEATLELEVFDEPQKELDGDSAWYNFTFRGYNCRGNDQIDKRQKGITWVSFTRRASALEFVCELVHALPQGYAKETLRKHINADLERSIEYEKKQLERLLEQ